jgi:hypothetical protein
MKDLLFFFIILTEYYALAGTNVVCEVRVEDLKTEAKPKGI